MTVESIWHGFVKGLQFCWKCKTLDLRIVCVGVCARLCVCLCFRFLKRLIGSGGVSKDRYITVFSVIARQTSVPGVSFSYTEDVCHYEENVWLLSENSSGEIDSERQTERDCVWLAEGRGKER